MKEKYEIEVVRSKRRRKTIQAKLTGSSHIRIMCPHRTDRKTLNQFIEKSVKKFSTLEPVGSSDERLLERAQMLKQKYVKEAPDFSINYSYRLRSTWGKCYFNKRMILINSRISDYPLWVTDMVIIHELAHLLYPDHGKDFRSLLSGYRLKERAVGFLMGKGFEKDKLL